MLKPYDPKNYKITLDLVTARKILELIDERLDDLERVRRKADTYRALSFAKSAIDENELWREWINKEIAKYLTVKRRWE